MANAVDRMLAQLGQHAGRPPVMQWQPALSGRMDMRIAANGDWYHEGGKINRLPLVKLFASILRLDDGLGYVLVTPAEKWQITVDDVPFVMVAMDVAHRGDPARQTIRLVSNVGDTVQLGPEHRLQGGQQAAAPYVTVRDQLQARLSRPVYYELAELAATDANGVIGVWSGGILHPLPG